MGMEFCDGYQTRAEQEWLTEICDEINHNNDIVKPRIAALTFDNSELLPRQENSALQHFNIEDSEGERMLWTEIMEDNESIFTYADELIAGEMANDEETRETPEHDTSKNHVADFYSRSLMIDINKMDRLEKPVDKSSNLLLDL